MASLSEHFAAVGRCQPIAGRYRLPGWPVLARPQAMALLVDINHRLMSRVLAPGDAVAAPRPAFGEGCVGLAGVTRTPDPALLTAPRPSMGRHPALWHRSGCDRGIASAKAIAEAPIALVPFAPKP